MYGLIRIAVVAVLSLTLAACAGKFKSDVSTFHQAIQPQGEAIYIVPIDDAKRGSLEFKAYADQVAARLTALGYRRAKDQASADLIVRLDYGVDEGQQEIRSTYSGIGLGYGGLGYGYGFGYGYGYDYGFGGFGSDIRSYTVYNRRLKIDIVRPSVPQTDDNWMVFEGSVVSRGRSNRMTEVMPLLVEAMFTGFPGQSGVTRRVILDLNK